MGGDEKREEGRGEMDEDEKREEGGWVGMRRGKSGDGWG